MQYYSRVEEVLALRSLAQGPFRFVLVVVLIMGVPVGVLVEIAACRARRYGHGWLAVGPWLEGLLVLLAVSAVARIMVLRALGGHRQFLPLLEIASLCLAAVPASLWMGWRSGGRRAKAYAAGLALVAVPGCLPAVCHTSPSADPAGFAASLLLPIYLGLCTYALVRLLARLGTPPDPVVPGFGPMVLQVLNSISFFVVFAMARI